MVRLKKFSIILLFTTTLRGQQQLTVKPNQTAFLDPGQTQAEITFVPPANAPTGTPPVIGQIMKADAKTPVSPQPAIESLTSQPGGSAMVTFANLAFWRDALVTVNFGGSVNTTYRFWRGVFVTTKPSNSQTPNAEEVPTIPIARDAPGELWIYNPYNAPVFAKWRIFSGTETFCGLNDNGSLRTDCDNTLKLPEISVPPGQSVPIRFYIPDYWRNPWHVFGGTDSRSALLQLRFGQGESSQQFDADLNLAVDSNVLDVWTAWVPGFVRNLFRAFALIGLGAAVLLFAQVVIPNFRRSLAMEAQIELLREQLRGINSGVGNRLYTRCQQELARVMDGLGIRDANGENTDRNWYQAIGPRLSHSGRRFREWVRRVGINSNTQEIQRIEGLLPRLQTRLDLTQRLSDILTRFLEAGTLASSPSYTFEREEKLRSLREILSRQLLTDAEANSVSVILDQLEDGSISKEKFAADLNERLEALRRQLKTGDFRQRADRYISHINGCKEILEEPAPASPATQWSVDEIIFRDLIAIKLRMILFAIEIECLLADKRLSQSMPDRLQSSDPTALAQIDAELKQISEGISEDDIREALKNELWDTVSEPEIVGRQDVPQFSFWFRNRAYNRCAARDRFQCYWKISSDSNPSDAYWEEGWTIQYIPVRPRFSVEPEIYDASGNLVMIKPPDSWKGADKVRVVEKSDLLRRGIRGLVDAGLTALVPVATVAVTQMDNSSTLSTLKLIALGFTSQAIRSAIIPESVRPEAASRVNPSDPRTASNPSPPPSASPSVPGPAMPSPSAAGPQTIAQPGTRQNEPQSAQPAPNAAEAGAEVGRSTLA